MDCDIAILIPCFNEEKTIAKVINDFIEIYKDCDFKIFVYDNNSTDNTFSIANSIDSVNVICRKEPRQGKGFVVRSMFQQIEANCYILVDGDDTYPADKTLEMVKAVKEDSFDMVIGDRLSTDYHKVNRRKFHSFGNNLVSYLINLFFHSDINDIMTGLRAFSRKFVKTSGLLARGFEIETEITILALDGNYKIKEIPISYKDRIEGSYSKLNTIADGFKVIKTIFILFKDYRAFEFFTFFFVIFTLIGLVLFLPVFIEYLKTGLVMRFPTLFVAIFFGILAILSECMGILLSTITKLHKRQQEISQMNFK